MTSISRALQSFPHVIFGCCALSLKKTPHIFSTTDPTSFWGEWGEAFKKMVICPLYLSDDENKWTCQVGHRNLKYISKSSLTFYVVFYKSRNVGFSEHCVLNHTPVKTETLDI